MENAVMEYSSTSVPPGFRFRPTEEELVGYYLSRKVNSLKIDLDVIIDIDLYRIEPWDIQERCKTGSVSEQNEWYFFSHKDRKYPTGTRTNRATAAGFWKATGRDKAVHSKEDKLIGMRKTLVYYEGRAPNGRKSNWIMHEYRIQASEHEPTQEEGWVVCRAFKKPSPSHKQGFEAWNNPNYYAIRPSSSSSDITNYRHRSSFPSNTSTNLLIHKDNILDDLGLISNQGGASSSCTPVNINQPPLTIFPVDQSDNDLKTGVISRLEISQMVELPKLDSPSDDKISSSFGDMLYNEWKSFDKLLDATCQVEENGASSSSYAYTNMHDYHDLLDDHTHINHVLECFPNL